MSLPAKIWTRIGQPTVRQRLTLIYAAIFALCGVALIAITLLLTAKGDALFPGLGLSLSEHQVIASTLGAQPSGQSGASSRGTLGADSLSARQAAADRIRQQALDDLYRSSAVALVITLSLAVLLSWIAAGRALAPLRWITATANRLTHENLGDRIALRGPPDELHDLANTLDAMLDRLSAAFDAQKRFVANASHELRTPLTRQRSLIDVALADPNASATSLRAMAERVQVAVGEQQSLIEGLLTLARGERTIHRSEIVDLARVAAHAIGATAGLPGQATGVRLTRELNSAHVSGDPELLERLAFNLIDNALTHNVKGGWVAVHTAVSDGAATIEVANGGPVVPEEAVQSLFEPFRRRGPDRTGARRGAGLGLSIVSAIAVAHGGTVEALPSVEGGLKVRVALPLAGDDAQIHPRTNRPRGRPG